MVKYGIIIYPRVYYDLDDIYLYISTVLLDPLAAKKVTDAIWDKIKSLELFPYSHQDRLNGKYANKGYKQLIINHYIVIYKIDEEKNKVAIITVQYVGRDL